MAATKGQHYKVLSELKYSGIRVMPGMVVDSILPESVGWLTKQGHIEPTDEPLSGKPQPVAMPTEWTDTATGAKESS